MLIAVIIIGIIAVIALIAAFVRGGEVFVEKQYATPKLRFATYRCASGEMITVVETEQEVAEKQSLCPYSYFDYPRLIGATEFMPLPRLLQRLLPEGTEVQPGQPATPAKLVMPTLTKT